MKKQLSEIGVSGLAVMGENLALNLANHHFRVSAWNRSYEKTAAFLERAGSLPVTGCRTPEEFVASLEQPRRILLMVKAGRAVDDCIEAFLPHLDPGDILMDGGNSLYLDTVRRERALGERGIRFLGVGISGGEEGALHGPSIMPGGDEGAWPCVKKYLQTIAAQVDGVPCCDWVGPEGSGHYVKMVHNGIEYADMELISEAYAFMRDYLRLDNSCMEKVFSRWSKGVLSGYLLDITAQIFRRGDPEGEGLLLDRILDAPGQKGTGRWSVKGIGEHVNKPGIPTTDWDWIIYPEGLFDLLVYIKQRYPNYKQIFITENGMGYKDPYKDGFVDDQPRIDYIEQHLRWLLKAMEVGVNVGGYFLWSLQDQFSWTNGYNKRYGFFYVDFETQKRTPKASAYWYKHVAQTRRLDE